MTSQGLATRRQAGASDRIRQAVRDGAWRDSIDLLYLHRHDPEVPYNESCEGIKALLDQGVAQWAGVSNVSIEQLKIAQEILGDKLVAVQNQYSPIHLDTQDTLDYCAEQGLAFVCWSPLGGYRHPYDEHLFDPFREVAEAVA